MTDSLFYNFESNYASLDDIGSHMNSINEAKNSIAQVFSMLGDVYEGDAASTLQDHHTKFQATLDDHMDLRSQTHKLAINQQDFMHALDRSNATQF